MQKELSLGAPVYSELKTLRRARLSLFNRLKSVETDVRFVEEMANLLEPLPLVANLRCGAWYSNKFLGHGYFKSTDGHTGKWDVNLRRLNLHLLPLIARHGGCIIVDSSRRKRIPDSFSKTVPLWAACINGAVEHIRKNQPDGHAEGVIFDQWDKELHTLASMVPPTEHSMMAARLPSLVEKVLNSGADLHPAAACLRKPLRPLWITPSTRFFMNDLPDYTDLPYYPVICLTASEATFTGGKEQRDGFMYIQGAADDHESWGMGLDHTLFWAHREELEACSTESELEALVKKLVLESRQLQSVDSQGTPSTFAPVDEDTPPPVAIGSSGLFIASVPAATSFLIGRQSLTPNGHTEEGKMECPTLFVVCAKTSLPLLPQGVKQYVIPVSGSKKDFAVFESHLPEALNLIGQELAQGGRVMLCCPNGTDSSVALAVGVLVGQQERRLVGKQTVTAALLEVTRCVHMAHPSKGLMQTIKRHFLSPPKNVEPFPPGPATK